MVNEKGFHSMKDAKRENPNKKVSRRKLFYQLITKEDFKTFEREEVKYSETLSLGMPRQLCQQSYESRHYKPTLPDTDLRAIMKGGRVGPRFDAQGAHIAVAVWRLLCQAHDEGTWKQLGTAWRALLFLVGSVCRTMWSDSAFLVLRTCEHGALLWPMSRHSGNGLIAFSPSVAQDAACEWKLFGRRRIGVVVLCVCCRRGLAPSCSMALLVPCRQACWCCRRAPRGMS